MSSVVKRATRSLSFRAMRNKNENKLDRSTSSSTSDSDNEDTTNTNSSSPSSSIPSPSSSSSSSSSAKTKTSKHKKTKSHSKIKSPRSPPSPSSVSDAPTTIPSPRSATSPRQSVTMMMMVPSPASSPGCLSSSSSTEIVAVNNSPGTRSREHLQEESRGRINSIALSPRRAALDVDVDGADYSTVFKSTKSADSEAVAEERKRRESESESGEGAAVSHKKGRGRANSTPAPRPSIVPGLTGLHALTHNSPSPPTSTSTSPKVLSSSKSSSAAASQGRKSGGSGSGGKLKQSKSARVPKSARGEGWSFTSARAAGIASSSPASPSLSSTPSASSSLSSSLSSSSSRLGSSSSSRRGGSESSSSSPMVEVVFAKSDATAWVRKHHITAEEARDHNTLVALMPSSMRRNIPMGDVLGAADQWTIDGTADDESPSAVGESGAAAKASAENESDKTKSEREDGERTKAYGSGEVHVFKRPAVAGLAIPSAREQPASALRTYRDEKEKEKEKTGGSTIIRRGMAAMASPRTWLGKKDDKDGMPAGSPPGGSPESHSPKNGERRKGWWDKKEKEREKEKEKEGLEDCKKEGKWRSRSKRLMRKKADADVVEPSGDKIAATASRAGLDDDEVHNKRTATTVDESSSVQPAEDEEQPSEGEDEEDIRGEDDDAVAVINGVDTKVKSSDQLDQAVGGEPNNAAAPAPEAAKQKPAAGQERRPTVVATKTVKMAMEEELLSRVKERAPNSGSASALGNGTSGGGAEDDDEEEDELFFSEANEAVVIQLPQKAE